MGAAADNMIDPSIVLRDDDDGITTLMPPRGARKPMTFPRQIDPNVTVLTCSDHNSRALINGFEAI